MFNKQHLRPIYCIKSAGIGGGGGVGHLQRGDSRGGQSLSFVLSDPEDVGARHNRFLDSITATWPGDDSFSVTWDESEGITRYRILVTGGSVGDYVKVCEDAVNEAQAEDWLADPTSSQTDDVNHIRVYTSTVGANNRLGFWSEWQEFPDGQALQRLDFLGSAAGPFEIFIEAE